MFSKSCSHTANVMNHQPCSALCGSLEPILNSLIMEISVGSMVDPKRYIHDLALRIWGCYIIWEKNHSWGCVCGTWVWTQGFALAKYALYCLSHTSSTFYYGYFWRWGLVNYLPGLALHLDPPISASQVARITGVSHQCPGEKSLL
jgi:hypothetical protein